MQKSYLYSFNYPDKERSLCQLELESLFEVSCSLAMKEKYLITQKCIDPSMSPYIIYRLSILCIEESLEGLIQFLLDNRVSYDNFKFVRFRSPTDELDYYHWISCVTELGKVIEGNVNMKNPSNELGATIVAGSWLFGEYKRNERPWELHASKPFTDSHSLEIRIARSIVNIAVGTDRKSSVIDPCCGVGTVVLEALSLGVAVTGYEIQWSTARKAKANIASFGYEPCITKADMHSIEDHYAVAILDIPYGLFTPTTPEIQRALIEKTRTIADKLVLIAFEEMESVLSCAGFAIINRGAVFKGHFKRYIYICQ